RARSRRTRKCGRSRMRAIPRKKQKEKAGEGCNWQWAPVGAHAFLHRAWHLLCNGLTDFSARAFARGAFARGALARAVAGKCRGQQRWVGDGPRCGLKLAWQGLWSRDANGSWGEVSCTVRTSGPKAAARQRSRKGAGLLPRAAGTGASLVSPGEP